MLLSYLVLFLIVSPLSWSAPQVKVLSEPSTPQEFIHQNPGCLENSECDPVMGHQINEWNQLIKNPKLKGKDKRLALSKHLKERGIPTEFYTIQKVSRFFKPMLFNSHCRNHNPKEGEKILRGTSFIKSLTPDKAVIWRDQTQIEFTPDEQLVAQPIKVYFDEVPKIFLSSLDDQPLFIKDHKLYILKEYEEEFFLLEIDEKGKWEIVDMDISKLSFYEDKKAHMECPNSVGTHPTEFEVRFCKGIWDESQSKLIPVEMYQGCAN
ncbi:MAG: hypothetical protein WCY48_00335 [Candidatus Caldatribacteriota bacterium]